MIAGCEKERGYCMKALRIVGLLGVFLAFYSGAAQRVDATPWPVQCVYTCDGVTYYGSGCNGSLATCCNINRRINYCADPADYQGYCEDASGSLIC